MNPVLQTRRHHLRLWAATIAGAALPQVKAAPAGNGWLLCTNKGDQTVSIIDPATNKQIATMPEQGVTGHELATSLDGKRVYVPIFGNSGVGKPGTDGTLIRVFDLETRSLAGTIDFGRGVRPHCPVMCAATGKLYVTTEIEKSVTVIDPATLKIIGTIPTEQEQSHMLAISKDGRRGYTANVGPGTVSVLDLQEGKVLKVIPICKMTQRISISMDDRFVFTSDQFAGRLAVIDTAAMEVKQWVEMPDIGYGTAPTPDSKSLVVALVNINEVGLIDLGSMKTVQTVKVPKAPQEVLVRPDGAVAYVSCDASGKVAVIDLKDFTVQTMIDTGAKTDGLAWAALG